MKEYDLDYHFDENLHEVADSPGDMEVYVHEKKIALSVIQNPLERVKTLGEIGVYLRILRQLDEARDYLLKALEMIERHNMDLKVKVSCQIRLAHVYQWQGRFELSNPIFESLQEIARTTDLNHLNDFIWQHSGKNQYDQMNWPQAMKCFERALALREGRSAPADQLQSSRMSIQACLQKMN